MDDTTFNLYNDGYYDTDSPAGENIPETDDVSGSDADSGVSDTDDIFSDILDVPSDTDPGDGTSSGTDVGDPLEESGEISGGENMEGLEEDADGEDGVETVPDITEALLFDTEVLSEIRDVLREHAGSVDSFMSGLTVSGNVLTVTPDAGTSALLMQSFEQQSAILDILDGMTGMIFLLFFVLVFDLLHRFARRIIKNFTGGDKNAGNP